MGNNNLTSYYCILDEAGNVIWERNVPTTPSGIRQAFGRIPRCRIALETGTHSPWVSRQLSELGHEVIVAHARNVRLIGESSRKDDQLDARTLARLARIDPGLLGPVRHRSAEAQIHPTVIRARAALLRPSAFSSAVPHGCAVRDRHPPVPGCIVISAAIPKAEHGFAQR